MKRSHSHLPLVSCGLFGISEDYLQKGLSLDERFIKNPISTYFFEASGDSMSPLIFPGDVLIVDKSIMPTHGKIVIAAIDGELTVKRLYQMEGVTKLQPDNPDYKDIDINAFTESVIWGVVTNVIHKV